MLLAAGWAVFVLVGDSWWQLAVAAFLRLVGLVLALIPVLGPLLMYVIPVVAAIAAGLVWLVLVVKALQGEMFKLPALGDLAEHYAGHQAIPGA